MRNLEKYGIDLEVAKNYAENLEKHLFYVREAGAILGVPKEQIDRHDNSKWSMTEFPEYANWFYNNRCNPDGFMRAYLHHLKHNPHHWQYWMFPDGFQIIGSSAEDGVVEMPENFVLEMVADWLGSSKAYTGSYDMTDWLNKNYARIVLHSKSRKLLDHILSTLKYEKIEQKELPRTRQTAPLLNYRSIHTYSGSLN